MENAVTVSPVEEPEFPVLGTEPLAVELANTLYGDGSAQVDFLRTPAWVDGWFAAVAQADGAPSPAAGIGADAARVRELRDRVRELVTAVVDGTHPPPGAVAGLNALARGAPTTVELVWAADGSRTRCEVDHGTGSAAVLGRVAAAAVELLAGASAAELRRCAAPDCGMFFVRHHPRRRWCHPSCGHRDRQARYYRRRLAEVGAP